jgi:hypothetical protein
MVALVTTISPVIAEVGDDVSVLKIKNMVTVDLTHCWQLRDMQ